MSDNNKTPPAAAYVPPAMRRPSPAGADTGWRWGRKQEESYSVRVSNLSDDTRDEDLHELFGVIGPVRRVRVATVRKTGKSRGYGYVDFVKKGDAEKAIEKLDGYGYDNLILRVEWAEPDD